MLFSTFFGKSKRETTSEKTKTVGYFSRSQNDQQSIFDIYKRTLLLPSLPLKLRPVTIITGKT